MCFIIRCQSHYHLTTRTGRAGRDRKSSTCILYYAYADVIKHWKIYNSKFLQCCPKFSYFHTSTPHSLSEATEETIQTHDLTRIHRDNVLGMTEFCYNRIDCRRKLLMAHFDEHYLNEKCDSCDVCLDVTERKVISILI